MRSISILLLGAALVLVAEAQPVPNTTTIPRSTAPTGTCPSPLTFWVNTGVPDLYLCSGFGGTWQLVGGGSGGGTVTSVATGGLLTGGPITTIGTISIAAEAANTVVMNATGGSAAPTAVAMPTCTTGAVLYNTSTHAWSCVSTGGATPPSNTNILQGNGSGGFGTGYTATGAGTIVALAGSPALTGTPTAPTQLLNDASTDIATDQFVFNSLQQLNPAQSVDAATTGILPFTPTYANGSSGVGATETAGSFGALVVDGYTVLLGDRVLVKNQFNPYENGVYSQTTLGTAGVAYILTRAIDYDTATNIDNSGTVPVINGSANGNTFWTLISPVTTIGSDPLTYLEYPSLNGSKSVQISNETGTGTTLYKLVKLTGAPSAGIITAISDTSGAIGICIFNCGKSGSATVYQSGEVACAYDAATTAGHFVQISSTTAGDCHDAGATYPTAGGQVIGRILSTHAAAGSFVTLLFSPDTVSGGSTTVNGVACALGSSCNANYTTGAVTSGHIATFTGTANQIHDGGAAPVSPTTNQNLRTIGAVLTPSALTACVYVPFAGTITNFHAVAGDGATASTVLVKVETQATFATFISTGVSGASDISNGGEQLTSVLGLVDTTLTSWGTTLAAGTAVCFVGSGFSVGTSVNANISVASN